MSTTETAPAAPVIALRPDEFRMLGCTVKPMTHEMAQQFSEMEGSVSERPIDEGHIKSLINRIERGWAVTFNWTTMRLPADETHPEPRVIRVNGHHSSTAVARMNGSFPEGLVVSHTELEGGSIEAAPVAFRQFDPMIAARSKGDVANAYQQIREGLREINPRLARVTLEGIGWYKGAVLEEDIESGDDLYAHFSDVSLHPFLKMCGGVVGNPKNRPEVNKPAVLGAFYAMSLVDESDCKDFLTRVVQTLPAERENGSDDPAKALSAWLYSIIVDKERKNADGSAVKAQQIYNGCAFAWRHFRDGNTLPRAGIKLTKKGAGFLPMS